MNNKAEVEEKVHDCINEFAGRGFRALGVAICENPKTEEGETDDSEWVYEGYLRSPKTPFKI